MEKIQYVIELGRNKTKEALSFKGCENMTFLGFYVCFVCYYKQKIFEQKKNCKTNYTLKTLESPLG
jgi:hypothetical protein